MKLLESLSTRHEVLNANCDNEEEKNPLLESYFLLHMKSKAVTVSLSEVCYCRYTFCAINSMRLSQQFKLVSVVTHGKRSTSDAFARRAKSF